MPSPRWGFDPRAARYRDLKSGRFISNETMTTIRDQAVETAMKEARTLAELAAKGEIDAATFRLGMRETMRNVYGSEAVFGRGGVHAMTQADWGRLGQTLRTQYGHLEGLVGEIANLDPEKAAARAALYVDGAIGAYEDGRAAAFGIELPARIPAHPSCFPAGTIVSGPRAVASTVRWYDGDLVEIRLGSGAFLAVTPNHPILTSHGWVEAGALDEGCDVVGGLGIEAVTAVVEPNDYDGPALIEEVAVSLRSATPVSTVAVPVAAEDFHGDGIGSQVCVVRTNGELRHGLDAALGQPDGEQILGGRDVETAFLTGTSRSTFVVPGKGSPSNGIVGGGCECDALVLTHSAEAQPGGFRAGARFTPMLPQDTNNGESIDADAVGDGKHARSGVETGNDLGRLGGRDGAVASISWSVDPGVLQEVSQLGYGDPRVLLEAIERFAGSIPTDRVIAVERRQFSGHVYNLETEKGWYIANGIIVHNCRCWWTYNDTGETVEVTWHTEEDANVCPDCEANADTYNAYAVPKANRPAGAPVRLTLSRSAA